MLRYEQYIKVKDQNTLQSTDAIAQIPMLSLCKLYTLSHLIQKTESVCAILKPLSGILGLTLNGLFRESGPLVYRHEN